jgi:CRP-like cAMP-binding protein
MYKKILLRSKLLRENISDECLNKLCLCVQEQQLSPDEILFEKGKPIDRMCFVLKGRIKIYFEKKIPKNRSCSSAMY